MSTELATMADTEHFSQMEKIAELKMKGETDTAIAKRLGIKRVQVIDLYNEFKDVLNNSEEARDRARDQLNMTLAHYDRLIGKLYDVIDSLDGEDFNAQVAAQKTSAIKQIGEFERQRTEMLQRAGMLDAGELGNELVHMEEQRDAVLNILRNDLCPTCRMNVMQKIGEMVTGKAEVVVVYDSE